MLKETEIIAKSPLSDWQKIEAINIFVISKAQYHPRASTPYRTWAQSIDKQIRKILKPSLKLPKRTATSFLYSANKHGGVGLRSLEDDLDTARVTHFFKCLTSPDQVVTQCAWSQLSQVVIRRTNNKTPTAEDIASFLNTPPPPKESTRCSDVQSIWSIVRKSLHRFNMTVNISPDFQIQLTHPEGAIDPTKRKVISKVVRMEAQAQQLKNLIEAPDQGRAFPLISKSPASNHWVGTGHYTSFSAYRFAMKARCNLLPVRTVLRRAGKTNNTTAPETLAHVLNACTPNTNLMRSRHNIILDRLKKATSKEIGTVFIDQAIPEAPGILRPDLVAKTDTSITIVDVTIPIESDPEAFIEARQEKIDKYSDLIQWAKTKYARVNFGVLVVGSLGSWDPENEETLKILGIGHKYAVLFRKLCCSDAIDGSLRIWKARSQPPTSSN